MTPADFLSTADEETKYLFYERSGMCIHDGCSQEEADAIALKAIQEPTQGELI